MIYSAVTVVVIDGMERLFSLNITCQLRWHYAVFDFFEEMMVVVSCFVVDVVVVVGELVEKAETRGL